jgi:hypothetical protein
LRYGPGGHGPALCGPVAPRANCATRKGAGFGHPERAGKGADAKAPAAGTDIGRGAPISSTGDEGFSVGAGGIPGAAPCRGRGGGPCG